MVKCGNCGRFLSQEDGIECESCSKVYHAACVNVPAGVTVNPDWVCLGCKSKIPKNDNANTSARENYTVFDTANHSSLETMETSHEKLLEDTAHNITEEFATQEVAVEIRLFRSEIRELRDVMQQFRTELKIVRDEVKEVKESVGLISDSIRACNDRMDAFDTQLRHLESQASPNEEKARLEKVVSDLQQELQQKDQLALLNDVEISNIHNHNIYFA